ncbi:hypothetical protein SAMN05216353_11667 [Halobacillus alkaliphilus]|uniref:Uncharacterized protein n=1 Tax=Halobacillus alkaliphilus TaxID=396056 RepID=A0A1I2N0I2_9BACI|nr:hypothetical protein [Halobacillus alkaliphilus]SFF97262.1 hypothetical protein SAMN05216353_11667 [Halobacillus alkaliphilus]
MKKPDKLSKKGKYQQRFAVIYLVLALFFVTVVLEDYNVFLVAAITVSLYVLVQVLIGIYINRKDT